MGTWGVEVFENDAACDWAKKLSPHWHRFARASRPRLRFGNELYTHHSAHSTRSAVCASA